MSRARVTKNEVVVSSKGAESMRRGHPWIFRSAVLDTCNMHDSPGSVCQIMTGTRQRLGCGVFDPRSPIAVRVWGIGTDATLDADVFRARTERALAVRRTLFADGSTTAYRILNGEGDRVPGIVLDRYADVAVLRIDGDAARHVAPDITRHLDEVLRREGVTTLLERRASHAGREQPKGSERDKRVEVRFGPARDRVHVTEHGVPFLVDVARGQKTGAFLDQRENRRRVGDLVRARLVSGLSVRVLNLFSYAGGFSIRAARAGATVTSLDVAAEAHASAQESFKLAGLDPSKHEFVTADAFAWLAEAKRRGRTWDVVISDPPSFAPSERAKPKALAAYRTLHRACADVLAPRGHLVASSCSSHVSAEEFVATLSDAALRSDLRLLEMFGLPGDHPTVPNFPEGRYLKFAVLT